MLYDRTSLAETFLPTGQMLQLDRIVSVSGDQLVAEMDLPSHWVFALHFPSDPIFPGSLLVEAAGQCVAMWAWHLGLRGKPRLLKAAAKFNAPLVPDDKLLTLNVTVQVRRRICFGVARLTAAGRSIAEIRPAVIVIPAD